MLYTYNSLLFHSRSLYHQYLISSESGQSISSYYSLFILSLVLIFHIPKLSISRISMQNQPIWTICSLFHHLQSCMNYRPPPFDPLLFAVWLCWMGYHIYCYNITKSIWRHSPPILSLFYIIRIQKENGYDITFFSKAIYLC